MGLEDGLDVTLYAHPNYSRDDMLLCREALLKGSDSYVVRYNMSRLWARSDLVSLIHPPTGECFDNEP